jgi:predicted HTH transcriptional regulator
MAGFVEAWGRGFELIAEAFKANGLEVPTLLEAQGGIRVIIKRELFYGIQQGGRIDPKTGRLIQADDTKNDTNDVTKKLTERQRLIYELLPFDVTEDDTKNKPITTAKLAKQFGKSSSTIKRDMKVL